MTDPAGPGTVDPDREDAKASSHGPRDAQPASDGPGGSDTPSSAPDDEFDYEQPDYVRLAILSSFLVVLICALVYTRFINPPKKIYYTDIPGVDLTRMSQAHREEVLRVANATPCDCGDPDCRYNVAECRHAMNAVCDVSLKRAGEIVVRVTGQAPLFTRAAPGDSPTMRKPVPPGQAMTPGAPTLPQTPPSPAVTSRSPSAKSGNP